MKIYDFNGFVQSNGFSSERESNGMNIDEANNVGKILKYKWRESFNNVWHETKCEVISHNDKTAVIKLLGFGKDGRKPGTTMRVQLKSLVGFETGEERKPDDRWKGYTYFD